jgi:hypothetical protein
MGHGRPLEPPDNSSMKNPQFATRLMGVAKTSPSIPRRDGEGTYKLVGEPPRSPRTGPGSGARRTATTPGVHRTQTMPDTCAWHRRSWLKYRRCLLKLTPRTPTDHVKKNLQEHPRSYKASGARPAGPLTRPHGIAPATRGRTSHQQASASAGSQRTHPQMLGGYCRGQP